MLLAVVFILLRQLLLHVRQEARPLRKEPLHLFPVVHPAVLLLVPSESVQRHLQDVVGRRHFFRSLEVRLVVRLPDDVIHHIRDEFLQLHGEDEHCDDHVPRVLGVVVSRRLTASLLVSGAHACHVFVFLGDEARQLRQLLAGGVEGATQTVLPESISSDASEALRMAGKCGKVIAAISDTTRVDITGAQRQWFVHV